jgi:DNA modification methylase
MKPKAFKEIKPGDKEMVVYQIAILSLKPATYNPRAHKREALNQLKESIKKYGLVDPIIANSAKGRENIVIGGHMRLKAAQELGYTEMPVVYINIPNLEKEKELNLRLNKNVGEWDFKLLADFNESFLSDVGFSSEDIDDIFAIEDTPEQFNLEKELKKLNINKVNVKKGERYQLGDSYLFCGDSTIEDDMQKLMNGEKADMCFTDPPYILDYLKAGKRKGNPTEGFGAKRNRRYLETDVLPPDFTEKWMANIKNIAKDNFSIIVYENWKNIPTIWDGMKKHWKIKNMLVWHLPNRTQGFAANYKFFSKHDIAMVGASGVVPYNLEDEEQELQNEYETALYAISGKPQWEGYKKGKKICPSDFIEFNADDAKHSGQGIIFGTKPLPILIPYIKVLTKRNDIIVEPFGGSGSTLIAATKMHRRCYIMEKSNVYAEVIINRWEKTTGLKAKKV